MKILDFRPPVAALSALRKGELLRLDGRRGLRITSRRGSLWLTQDGDPNDVVLDPGQAHCLEADGPVLIQALDRACVSVDAAASAPPSRWARWRDAWSPRPAFGGVA